MFIGREHELNTLEKLYKKDKFSLAIIYGRRRVGKSTLIKEFIKNKKAIYFTATKVGGLRNFELFQSEVLKVLNPDFLNASFKDLDSFLDVMSNKIDKEKIILVIDELPYWASSDKSIISILQKYIDIKWCNSNLMLILCGSSLSFMEDEVLSEKSPLFGRRDCQIKLNAFDYIDAAKFVPNYSHYEKAIVYGVTGGIAKYLEFFDESKNLDDNIKELYFDTNGYLYDEPRNYLIQEFNDVSLVNNVVEQIAQGENTLNDISNKIHQSNETTLYILKKLINVDIVEKRSCITERNNKKKTLYCLKDTMFKFWYQFIAKAISSIEIGNGFQYYDQIVKENLHNFMGPIFEDMCRYYVLKNGFNNTFSVNINDCGFWWGTKVKNISDNKIVVSSDIDVVGISNKDNQAIIGECKFKNDYIDKEVYESLYDRDNLLKDYKIVQHLFFSLSGYSKWVQENKTKDDLLFTLDDIYF